MSFESKLAELELMTLISPHPFVESVDDRLPDELEIAVAQVEEKFFERASDFNPRMTPAHDAIDTFLIRCMLDDVARVFQRKVHLVALHGKDTAVTTRKGAERASEVYGVGSCAQIVDHVTGRHDAETGIEQDGGMEDGFVISLSVFTVTVAHVDEIVAVTPRGNEVFQLAHAEAVVKKRIVFIPLVDDPPPACPSPDGERGGKEVVVRHIGRDFFVVESGNHADAGIVLVAVEHFLTEAEKTD